ncbi:mycofactocin biosynthesis peptidyl-dipeptidase MftE [Nesterenkonia alkaliphila]|uniref:Mycofactocin biosynthesis peptidyl-dipeptidase MftE n=1 Tax=Nesterenkonia alkaliphila TaxID=1463631 RepID=A0A7K1UFD1_9MICC|nr:mycofactocin biosynthesis peptidyl-dipeptidase MftE [Nesterenkonia alkaliphila]MVT25185.1 mycofactocin biosynthesis peptidyl-dipeptidase MftE [Nesterenkonia alkaliphila]GFZ93711.1 hypothetical protein GCM10011359_24050 [Nesterenkonia alkaliphila]
MTEPPSTETPHRRLSALEYCAWPELTGRAVTVLLPLGSTEQHGPHLPLNTDTVIATAVAKSVAQRIRTGEHHALVSPALPYGSSGEHQQFSGTVSIGQAALARLLVEYGRSVLEWASRLIFVNGHGGNLVPLRQAVEKLHFEGREVQWASCSSAAPDPSDSHAGLIETSLMLYLEPEQVDLSKAAQGNTQPLHQLLPELRRGGVQSVSSNGVLGDPRGASADAGRRTFEQIIQFVLHQLDPNTKGAYND